MNQLVESCERSLTEIVDLLKKKNSDYSGDTFGPYKNFLDPELQALLDNLQVRVDAVELGIRIRLRDKWSRLNTLLLSGSEPLVLEEKLEDTLNDVIGYSLIWKAYREFKRETTTVERRPFADSEVVETVPRWRQQLLEKREALVKIGGKCE